MPILVDTGAVELLRRRDRRAESLVLRHYPPVICTHVVGEFLFGQAHAKVSATAFQEAREFLDSFEILHPDADTAAIYGRLRAQLAAGISVTRSRLLDCCSCIGEPTAASFD